MIKLALLFTVIIAFIAVLSPSKKVSKDKFDLDFREQDEENKKVNV